MVEAVVLCRVSTGIELDTNNQALWTALAKVAHSILCVNTFTFIYIIILQAQDSFQAEKSRRYEEAARERKIEEEAVRQRDMAKAKAKAEEDKRRESSEKQQVEDFLSLVSEAPETTNCVQDDLSTNEPAGKSPNDESDLLAGFFSELTEDSKAKERQKEEKTNQARAQLLTEKYTTQDLGTGKAQYERLTQKNYVWKNQNPYYVMQLGIDATEEDIKNR